jgi:CubicO group peptidase (beta-lactamase class C family)
LNRIKSIDFELFIQQREKAVNAENRDGQLREMPFLNQPGEDNALGPSGGIVSCASDMAKWLQLHLKHGEASGQTIISAAGLEEMLTAHLFIDDPQARERYGFEFTSYGLGWGMHTYQGNFLVEHDGMTDGFYALASLLPRLGLGIVALSNCDAYYNPVQDNLAPNIVTYTLYDRLLGLEPVDWNARMQEVHADLTTALQSYQGQADPDIKVGAPPSHPMEAYLGDYQHPGYGVVSIRKAGERLESDLQGKVARIAAQLEPRVNEIIFNRLAG